MSGTHHSCNSHARGSVVPVERDNSKVSARSGVILAVGEKAGILCPSLTSRQEVRARPVLKAE